MESMENMKSMNIQEDVYENRKLTRGQYGDIQQDVLRKEQEAVKADASTRHLERRRERLSQLNQYNGFNPITGIVDKTRGVKKDENNWLLDGKPSKIQVGEGPSTELQVRTQDIRRQQCKSRRLQCKSRRLQLKSHHFTLF